MRSSRVKQFLKKEPNLSFVAAKIQQSCTVTGTYRLIANICDWAKYDNRL